MRYLKGGGAALSKAEHSCLVEALRRRYRFNTEEKCITDQWTGLGASGDYKAAQEAGLMCRVSTPNPRHLEWWHLTGFGARIVVYWIGQGYTLERIEAGDIPSADLPKSIL